jgi:prepilin-type N-terminal cleavage/methylation domain-containing protein
MKSENEQRNSVMGRAPGYTLIEMLIVLAIVSFLFSAVFGVLNIGNTSFSTGSARQTVENQARQGLDHMLRELYETNGGRIVLSDANSVITFKLPVSFDGSGNLLWGAEGIDNYKIKYLVDSNKLVRKVLDSTDNLISQKVLAVDIESLLFALDISRLTITLNAKKKVTGTNYVTASVSTKIAFRN